MPDAEPSPSLAQTVAPSADLLRLLLEEFRRAGSQGDYWNRDRITDDTRLARWDGQTDDGKKWDSKSPEGLPAFPWNGASDVRCYQSDEVINEGVAINTAAFWRADVRVESIQPENTGISSACTTFVNWMRSTDLRDELETEVELSTQFSEWKGWTVLHVAWDRQIAYKNKIVKLDDLVQTAQSIQSAPNLPPEIAQMAEALFNLPNFISDVNHEGDAAKIFQLLYRVYVNNGLPADLLETDIPELAMSKARAMIRDLRDRGQTTVPFPYLCKNRPTVTALKPWRDVVFPTDTTDAQNARAVFMRRLMSEAEIRSMVLSDGWDADFVEAAVATKGFLSVWSFSNQGLLNPLWNWQFTNQKNQLIEVILAYHKAVDEDGITAVYYTVFNAHCTQPNDAKMPLVGKAGIFEGPRPDQYPIAVIRREQLDRQVMSARGVPEILLTSQREEKVLRDGIMDWTSIGTIPPINIYKGAMGQRFRIAPAAENMVTPGREPKFMEVPGQGPTMAVEWRQQLLSSVDHYFGRFREDVPPALSQLLMEPRVRRFLSGWSQALKIAFEMYLHFAPDTFERITQSPAPSGDQLDLDFMFHFDVAQLHPDLMTQKLQAFTELLPEDSAGVLNRAELTRAKARMIDPNLARSLVMDEGPATMAMVEGVRNDMVKMSDGNEAIYSDASNDPAAQTKMQILKQTIASNPKYQSRLDPKFLSALGLQPSQISGSSLDQLFSKLVQNYTENLQQGISQQQNKQIGRTGVRPMTPIAANY